jgi:hypothetical protein
MPDVRDEHFAAGNHVEDEIVQARNDDDPGVGFVRFAAFVRGVAD